MIRFLIGGGINTAVTYGLYWLLLLFIHYQLAYVMSYVFGIFLSYFLNLKFVFFARHTLRKVTAFPLIYVFNYICGASVIAIVVRVLHWDARIAPLIAVAVTLPLTFLLTRRILVN